MEQTSLTLSPDAKRDVLAATPLFAAADQKTVELVAERSVEVAFGPDQQVARQGDIGAGMFIVVSGAVRVVREGETIARIGPGEVVGELSVIDRQPRVAQVVADEPTTLLALASWDLEQVIRSEPEVALALLRVLAQRLRQAVRSHSH